MATMDPIVPEMDIARQTKALEWLKAELVAGVGEFFRSLLPGNGAAADALANILMLLLILARRLGIDLSQLDRKVDMRLRANLEQRHELELWFGDLSAILRYRTDAKR